MRLLVAALAALALVAARADVAEAAAPRIVIFSGASLPHRVVISDWEQIFAVVGEVVGARGLPRQQLDGRPRLQVAIFWGPRWNDYLAAGNSADVLRPKDADQFGTFYPAWHGRPALIALPWAGSWPRAVSARALAVLERYGVPVAVTAPDCSSGGAVTKSPTGSRLWTSAPPPVFDADPRLVNPDGSIWWKSPWYAAAPRGKPPRAGPKGTLHITGRRLDGDAPRLRSRVVPIGVLGFTGSGSWAVMLTFPVEGCWRVTGRVERTTYTFTTLVRKT